MTPKNGSRFQLWQLPSSGSWLPSICIWNSMDKVRCRYCECVSENTELLIKCILEYNKPHWNKIKHGEPFQLDLTLPQESSYMTMNYDKSHLMGQMVHEDSTCVSYKDSINDALVFWSSRAFHLITEPAKCPLYLHRTM